MKLERIEISGFRGIKRLSIAFDELTTLIGENTWGKSSLLDALSVSLPPEGTPYNFEMTDFTSIILSLIRKPNTFKSYLVWFQPIKMRFTLAGTVR